MQTETKTSSVERHETSSAKWSAIVPRLTSIAVPALIFAIAVLAVYWRAWTPIIGERRAFGWDSQWQYWGELQFQVDSFRSGHWPLWNPYDRFGYPFYADPQPGTMYPLQWPLILAGIAMKATPWWLVTVKTLVHLWLLPTGMYALCRYQKFPVVGAYIAGMAVLISQPMSLYANSALSWSFVWSPWWLLAMLAWLDKPTWRRSIAVGTTFSLCALAGGWAAVWYAILVVLPISTARAVTVWRQQRSHPLDLKTWRSQLLWTVPLAAITVALLAGPQILATASLLPHTVRADRDLAFFGTSVFDAVDLMGYLLPRGQGQNTYLGWIPLLLAGMWVIRKPSLQNMTLLAIFIAGVLLSFGDRGPVLPALGSVATPFELFRRAHRYSYMILIPFGLLVGGGMSAAIEAVRSSDTSQRDAWLQLIKRVCIGMFAICAIAFANRATDQWKPNQVRDSFAYAAIAASVGGAALWLYLKHGKGRASCAALVTVVFCDLWFARHRNVDLAFQDIPRPRLDQAVSTATDLPLQSRFYDIGKIGYRPGTRLHLRDIGGYEDDPLALKRFDHVLQSIRSGGRFAAHAGAGYLFAASDKTMMRNSADQQTAFLLGPGQWQFKRVAPTVAWYDAAAMTSDAQSAWKAVTQADPGDIAVVESKQWSDTDRMLLTVADSPNTSMTVGTLHSFEHNQLQASISAPSTGLVVVGEMFYPTGWQAWVDDAPANIYAVNGYARGLLVGPGDHSIVMTFLPTGFWWKTMMSLLAWLGVGLVCAASLVKKARRNRHIAAISNK
jgi:hypothetical protein